MIALNVKTTFNASALVQLHERVGRRWSKIVGYQIRKQAQVSIRRGKRASSSGQPPRTRKGKLRRAIFYNVETGGVVVGPGYSRFGTAGEAHEFGGRYKKQTYPRRPFMGPALKRIEPKMADIWAEAFSRG